MSIKYSRKRKQHIKNKTNKYKYNKYKSINKNLKRKQHKYILKGGNMNIIEASSFNDIPPANDFNAIYIAIGGKYHIDYPSNIENLGLYELFPNFLFEECQQNNLSKALIIIIDEFNRELEINKSMARNIYAGNESLVDNINTEYTFVFVNSLFNDSLVNQILMYLTNKREDAKLWICNYVYFFNPNELEEKIAKKVNDLVKKLAGPNNMYINDIYRWIDIVNRNYVVKINCPDVAIQMIVMDSKRKPISEKQKKILQNNLLDISGMDVYQIYI